MDAAATALGPVTLTTPLGEGVLTLRAMDGSEMLGVPFEYEIEVICADPAVKVTDLLTQPVSVALELPVGGTRYFHGLVTEVSLVDAEQEVRTYRARINPWLSMLAHRTNCRIFQRKTIPDIVAMIFREHGYSDFERRLSEHYELVEFVVQYRESDFAFVSRLLEQVGIYYYFSHEETKHTLVLADSLSAHEPAPDYDVLPFRPPDAHRGALVEHVLSWQVVQKIQAGTVTSRDFNFKIAPAVIESDAPSPEEYMLPDYKLFDYPGGYSVEEVNDQVDAEAEKARAGVILRRQMDQLVASQQVATANTNARGLLVGRLFSLTEHPVDDANREYLITSAHFRLSPHDPRGTGSEEDVYACRFSAIDSSRAYRPARTTPRPFVHGPQTAQVVGKAGEDIWTDDYGRVKVHFHWDQTDQKNEDSSCWVRVSQAWAGSGFGSMHIPRIGQEVIVDFLEGDPDHPIITGRVYNKANLVPYTLPPNQTQSGIKSRSTPHGNPDNFNELRFEDKKGEEELFIQAEKNQTTKVKNNQSISVGADRSVSVGGNESISVQGTRSSTITKKETQTFKAARQMTVGDTDTETITNLHTGTYHGGRKITVDTADDVLDVNGVNKVVTVHGKYNVVADTLFEIEQGGNTLHIEKNIAGKTAGGPISFTNGSAEIKLEGGKISITANDEISLVCGQCSITLTKGGTLDIKGAQKVNVGSGGSTVSLDPTGVNVSGTKVSSAAIGMHEITGAMVKIN